MYAVLSSDGFVNVLTKEINFQSRYSLDQETEVLGIRRQVYNLIYFTQTKVGFSKIIDSKNANQFCEAGTSTIVDVTTDSSSPGVFYAATMRGEILIFEAQNRADSIDCKVKGKLLAPGVKKLFHSNHLLTAQLENNQVQIFKTFDQHKILRQSGSIYTPPALVAQDNKEPILDFSNSLLVQMSHEKKTVVITQCTYSSENEKKGGDDEFDFSLIRYMIFAFAIICVALWQYNKHASNRYQEDNFDAEEYENQMRAGGMAGRKMGGKSRGTPGGRNLGDETNAQMK